MLLSSNTWGLRDTSWLLTARQTTFLLPAGREQKLGPSLGSQRTRLTKHWIGPSSPCQDVWKPHSFSDGRPNGERNSCSLPVGGPQSVSPRLPDRRSPALGQMTVNGTKGDANTRPDHLQRSFSPVGRIPSPPVFSQQMTALQKTRPTAVETQKSNSPDNGKGRATSTGTMDEDEVPTTARMERPSQPPPLTATTADKPKHWYKTMFQDSHKPESQDVPPSLAESRLTPESKACWSQSKNKSDTTAASGVRSPSVTPQKKEGGGARATSEPKKWRPPDKKVDTWKYTAEPSSVNQREPEKSSPLEQEEPAHDTRTDDTDLEDEPWVKFFSELEFGRPPPKKHLDYSSENPPQGLSENSRYQSPVNRIPDRPSSSLQAYTASSAGHFWQRRNSEPIIGPQRLLDEQSSWRPTDPLENGSVLRKPSAEPLTPSLSRMKEKDTFRTPTVGQSRGRTAEKDQRKPARALYDFKAQTAKELAFKKGDVLYISRKIDSNWYEGEHHGQLGIFPVSYVEIVLVREKNQSARAPSLAEVPDLGEAVARYNFTAETNVELPLRKGERVILLRCVDQNWFEGKIAETDRKGIFPVSYVNVIKKPPTKRPGQYAEPSLIQSCPSEGTSTLRSSKERREFLEKSGTRPRLNTPSPTSRHRSLQSSSPTITNSSNWMSLTPGLSPSSTPAPTPPPFPTNFLPNATLDSLESLTPSNDLPALREGHFIPIKSAKAFRCSPELQSSPIQAMSSYASSPASPMFDCDYKYSSGDVSLRKSVENLPSAFPEGTEMISTEPSTMFSPSISSDLVASALTEVLPFYKAIEEDVCEELVSFIQEAQSRKEFTEKNKFHTQASDITEELPKLYIEEDPCENTGNTKLVDSKGSKQEVNASLSSPVDLPAFLHPTEAKMSPSSPCSTPPLPGTSHLCPIPNKYPPRPECRSPKTKPALKRDVIVVGKPPRSPLMSRRFCGSPIRGSSSHRPQRAAFGPDSLQSGGEPFQALYNYTPHNEDELELTEGDVVDVMEKCDDGWFVGISRRSKLFGTFPGNYVKRL
ncbi:sorbin and SH3 domain-containing protein 1-like isoform X2 [Paramormyrops kingsleyae]|uniref:sorbin and SH3 domain-containing protein 1-like isoform X2 n=1 Tax=Paramormyrops kingsleyae TaxID=1676925 RepID=UPI003B9793BB